MSSTLDDGDAYHHDVEEDLHSPDLPDETEVVVEASATADGENEEIQEDVDTLPELEPTSHQAGEDEEEITNGEQTPIVRREDVARPRTPVPSSVDDSASIPDDTPSVQDSGLSSPRSDLVATPSPLSRNGSSAGRRPFEKRFQSRLSSSYLGSPRAASPAFLGSHSRHSSLASFAPPSEPVVDESTGPWEVIRWTKLKKLTGQAFSETGRRNFGNPTCLYVTDQIVIGTSRGLVLVFDHQQNHKAIIGSGTPAIECGAVTSLSISADHTTVAAGHASGHIFTWEISKGSRPFLHIPPLDNVETSARKGDGHVRGSAVLHIGFLGYRRTALVSADDKGMAFSHLASRGTGALGRSVRTTRVLGRYPEVLVRRSEKPIKKSSVLAFSPLPLGNVEQSTDALGLVAMLTPYLLVIVSTTPIAQTQHKAARPKEVAAHSAMTAALAWFPAIKLKGSESEVSKNKLAYAWSNVLIILEVDEVPQEDDTPKDKPPELVFQSRNRYQADEAIVAVQWLSRSVLALLTITQQLLIIEDITMNVTDSFDLLPKNLYHADLYSHQLEAIIEHHDETDTTMHGVVADAYHMSFRAYKGRLYLLGVNDTWWGALTNWADRLLAMMEVGDFIGALKLATAYYGGRGEKVTIGLPEDDESRKGLLNDRLLEMMGASLKLAFGKNEQAGRQPLDRDQLEELAVACVSACLQMGEQDFLFDEVFTWYNENESGDIFVNVLEPHILDRQVSVLPPPVVKTLITQFSKSHSASKLEEIICLLDATAMDIDQVTTLCKQHHLYDAYIYVWNTALFDYVSPLKDLLSTLTSSETANGHVERNGARFDTGNRLFAYLSFSLTGRIYPVGEPMEDDRATSAKMQLYDLLFSGNDSTSKPFSTLKQILHFDTASFMASLNEAFEDGYLNQAQDDGTGEANDPSMPSATAQGFTRQMIVQILLEVMSTGFSTEETIYLNMFIARNLPKYSQYMVFRGAALENIFASLCRDAPTELHDDAQLSVEYLMQVYQPPYISEVVSMLTEAKFFRVLKSVFRQEQQWTDLITTYFHDSDDKLQVFDVISECLRVHSTLTKQQRGEVHATVKSHADDLLEIDIEKTATTVDHVMASEHGFFIQRQSADPNAQFRYLRTLFEPTDGSTPSNYKTTPMMEEYVRLMCQFDPGHVVTFVRTINETDLRLDEVMPAMESSGNIDAAVLLLARQGETRNAMTRLVRHLSALQSALTGIIETASDSPDEAGTSEAIKDLLDSIDQYAQVGIWLCQTLPTASSRSVANTKSPKRTTGQQFLSFEEELWIDFITSVVAIAQEVTPLNASKQEQDDDYDVPARLRQIIQRVFSSLLATTATSRGTSRADDFAFLRIFRSFLSRAAESSPSLAQLRHVISSIFSAYSYEESLRSLSNAMLDKDLFVQVDEVLKLRRMGWRPRGQTCEICRRRVWGPGTGVKIWDAWEKGQKQKLKKQQEAQAAAIANEDGTSRGKGKANAEVSSDSEDEEQDKGDEKGSQPELGPIVVFSCRHLYHRKCLEQSQQLEGHDEAATALQEPVRLVCPSCVQSL